MKLPFYGFFLLLPIISNGQQSMQIVEKEILKKIPVLSTDIVTINAEKADVFIHTWSEKFIQMKLIFSARHPDKLKAQSELEYLKYSVTREGKAIVLMNSFIVADNVIRIESRLNVRYELSIPENTELAITNSYGGINLTGEVGKATLSNNFGDITLNKLEAKEIVIASTYANIRAIGLQANVSFKTSKSTITLEDSEGSYSAESTYGNIDIMLSKKIDGLKIQSSRTSVIVRVAAIQQYNYELQAENGAIYIPEDCKTNFQSFRNGTGMKSSFNKSNPVLIVGTRYSSITIKK